MNDDPADMDPSGPALGGPSETGPTPDRAGDLIREQIQAILGAAEARSAEAERLSVEEAAERRQEAMDVAGRVVAWLDSITDELDDLSTSLRREADSLAARLEGVSRAGDLTARAEGPALTMPDRPAPGGWAPLSTGSPEARPSEGGGEAEREDDRPLRSWEAPVPERSADAPPPEPAEPSAPWSGFDPAPSPAQESVEAGGEQAEPAPSEPEAESRSESESKRRFLRLRRRGGDDDLKAPAHCGSCRRPTDGRTIDELRKDGWELEGEEALCPDCVAKGWRLTV